MTDFETFNEAQAWVKEHKDRIQDDALQGHYLATAIVTTHRLMVARPDPAAEGLFIQSVNQYRKELS